MLNKKFVDKEGTIMLQCDCFYRWIPRLKDVLPKECPDCKKRLVKRNKK